MSLTDSQYSIADKLKFDIKAFRVKQTYILSNFTIKKFGKKLCHPHATPGTGVAHAEIGIGIGQQQIDTQSA